MLITTVSHTFLLPLEVYYDAMECSLRSLEALCENVDHRHYVAMISEKLAQKVYTSYIC